MDKLIQVNSRTITSPPKMSLLLEVEPTPAVIIKQMITLVGPCYEHGLQKSEQNIQLAETNEHSISQQECRHFICFAKAAHILHAHRLQSS